MIFLSTPTIMKTISLAKLLSSCMDASRQGCDIIRDFQKERKYDDKNTMDSGGRLKEANNIRSVVTQADLDAQARIVGGLRSTWGNDLRIIGEEDDDEAIPTKEGGRLDTEIFSSPLCFVDDENIPIEELTIFVDPLDGTREFVEGRLQNVACLVGIARGDRPIAGVIGVPFPHGTSANDVKIYYAVADQTDVAGVWPNPESIDKGKPFEVERNGDHTSTVTFLTGDSKDPVLFNATSIAKEIVSSNYKHVIVGGTAAKLRMVATEVPNSIAILHFKTELWDTCAAQALLQSQGGMVTDLFGSPLVHSPARPFGNIFGVVASSGDFAASQVHNELCRRMRGDGESVKRIFGKYMGPTISVSEPQAIDIARDLDGVPFCVEDIRKLLNDKNPEKFHLNGYTVPESDAWRGMMSNGVRFSLDWKRDSTTENIPPSDIFLKRVVMADLAHARNKLKTAPHKLVRDVKSYQVESSFLTSEACRCLVDETKLNLNKVLGSDLRPMPTGLGPKGQLQSRFLIFLEYFQDTEGWRHQWLLDEESAKTALSELAKMHAYFWKGSNFWGKDDGELGTELEAIVWPNGGYMQPNLQGLEQLKEVENGWKARYPSFQEELATVRELEGVNLASLGKRLEDVAASVGRMAHPFSEGNEIATQFRKYRTFIHGDPKQANFFFRRNFDTGELEVGIIDFQWSGFGLAATDVAHHIASAVMPNCLSRDGKKEAGLLDHYHSCLTKNLIKFGVASNSEDVEQALFPRAVLQEQYETALLDLCRMVFAYSWSRWKLENEATVESLNRNAYNKSLPNVLWLICRCHSLLDRIEKSAHPKCPAEQSRRIAPYALKVLIERDTFQRIVFGALLQPTISKSFDPSPTMSLSDSVENVCQNGGMVEERAIPGAYSSDCMMLPERIIPLQKLLKRHKFGGDEGSIIIRQKPGGSGATGMTVWNSGLLLARLLDELVDLLSSNATTKDFWSRQNVIELGCGTGIVSIAAHLLGARSVVATDGNEQVLELARSNIRRNTYNDCENSPIIEARLLQWGLLNAMDFSECASLVLGADLTYNAGSWKALAETMETVLSFKDGSRVLYLSLGHEGFNVNAEIDGFLSVAKEVGLAVVSELEGIDVNSLLQNSLTSLERLLLSQTGGARVFVLTRKYARPANSER